MSEEQTQRSRRDILKVAGVAAGALAGGSLLGTGDASAADGGNLVLGSANSATSETSLATSGTISNNGALSVTAPSADFGVYASSVAAYGVVGSGPGGVLGLGVVGGTFSGSDVAIHLVPIATAGPPTGDSLKGDLVIDVNGVLWLCIGDGTPGVWIKASHGGIRPFGSPVRLYDSRLTGGIFAGGETRTIDVTAANIGVPDQAVAFVGNLTVTETTDVGFLTAWPAGVSRPITSNLNWAALQTIANSAIVALGSSGQISLYVERSEAQVIVDVIGYVL